MVDDILDVMHRGGGFMWVILLVSIAIWTTAAERIYVLWVRYYLNVEDFSARILDALDKHKFSRALEVCNGAPHHPLAQVLKAGLLKANGPDKDIQRAMEAALMRVFPALTSRTTYLSMLANVATLLGLLGTILGLIEAFRGVAEADAAAKQDILSKGIAVAMFTTAFGLIAAIPGVFFYCIFQSRQNTLLVQLEGKATELLNYLSEKNRAAAKKAG